ncbi:MAG: 3-keto-disaccharide hydrolase, partial [Tangfeifania sp.]
MKRILIAAISIFFLPGLLTTAAQDTGNLYENEGYKSLFNGKNLDGWVIPEGDNGHWSVIDGVIDYDARSEAKGDKNLWTEEKFKDFKLHIEWRFKGYGDHLFP